MTATSVRARPWPAARRHSRTSLALMGVGAWLTLLLAGLALVRL